MFEGNCRDLANLTNPQRCDTEVSPQYCTWLPPPQYMLLTNSTSGAFRESEIHKFEMACRMCDVRGDVAKLGVFVGSLLYPFWRYLFGCSTATCQNGTFAIAAVSVQIDVGYLRILISE
jgi:hypothetical protein